MEDQLDNMGSVPAEVKAIQQQLAQVKVNKAFQRC